MSRLARHQRNMSPAAMTKAAPDNVPDPPLCDWRDALPRESSRDGASFFSEVKLSRRRHFHRVSLPRSPRVSRRAKEIPTGHQKRAFKRRPCGDCGRRCVLLRFRRWSLTSRRSPPCIRCLHGGRSRAGNVVVLSVRLLRHRPRGHRRRPEFFGAPSPGAGQNFIARRAQPCRALEPMRAAGESASPHAARRVIGIR